MPVLIIEAVGWVLWGFIFYNSGSALLRLISFGKVKHPIIYPSAFRKEKTQLQNVSLCYLVGMIFYMGIAIIFIAINN